MEDENTCYYYDAGTNHCRCYGNESLDALLAENARLKEEMRDLEAYDQILRDQLNQDHELRRIAESENVKLKKLIEDYADSFEKDAAMNNGNGPYYSGEDWLSIANDMRIDLAGICRELAIEV